MAKPQIFDPGWLQAGYIVKTQDGVFVNIKETGESKLKQMLDKCEKINGIYLGKNDFGFIPYETFETGVQESGDFIEGGLARGLEYARGKKALNFEKISFKENYRRGVNVFGFDEVKQPTLKVATLYSARYFDDDRLSVDGDDWGGYNGCAFGVLGK